MDPGVAAVRGSHVSVLHELVSRTGRARVVRGLGQPNVYFTDSARKQIRFRKYRSEHVAHLARTNEDMHRLVCD
jgi:hypothetical protein